MGGAKYGRRQVWDERCAPVENQDPFVYVADWYLRTRSQQ
jgi:hypothetical protein